MKNRIILPKKTTIYYIVLIILFVLVFTSQLNFAKTVTNNKTIAEANTPEWHINDKWTYFANINLEVDGEELKLNCSDLKVDIFGASEEYYALHFNGNIKGSGKLYNFRIRELIGTIDGYIDFGKTNFSLKKIYDVSVSGNIWVGSPPVKVDFEINIDNAVSYPNIELISFPLNVGKDWKTSVADLRINGGRTIAGSYADINMSQPEAIPSFNFNCHETSQVLLENYGISVMAYNISEKTNDINILYSPEISSFVKLSFDKLKFNGMSISTDLSLKNTSFLETDSELSVELVNPKEGGIYMKNSRFNRICKLFKTLIIGKIDLEAIVPGNPNDVTVSFYLDDECKETIDESPYKCTLNERMFLKNCKICVKAEDSNGRVSEDYIFANIIIF